MARFERICPECGAGNSYDKTQCVKCRAPLTRPPQSLPPPVAALSRRGMAILAWRATKFMTRLGFGLAVRGAQRGVAHVRERNSEDVKNETIDGEYRVTEDSTPVLPEEPVRLREWRVYTKAPDAAKAQAPERLSWGKKK